MKGLAIAATFAYAALASCSNRSTNEIDNNVTGPGAAGNAQSAEAGNSSAIAPEALPPTIVKSSSYRCTDGNALYLDIRSDKASVTVRNSRTEAPTLLTRSAPGASFTGDGTSLSGTGNSVRYSSPDRPNQTCTEAAQ